MAIAYYPQSPFAIPDEAVAVTVASSGTIGSGGALDWWGRAAMKRRPSDDAILLAYQRSTNHSINDGTGVHLRFSDDDLATVTDEDEDLDAVAIAGAPLLPTVAANQDAGEPWLIVCANDDIICHTWRVDYGADNDGTWQFRSTDGGHTWVAEGQVTFTGLANQSRAFATDDHVVMPDGTIYAVVRLYSNDTYTACSLYLVKSEDDGAAWTLVSELMADDEGGNGGIEAGLEYLGDDTFIAMIRDTDHVASYKRVSTDLGATWGSLVDVTSTVGIGGRQRLYTRAHLKGQPRWWQDPVLVMVGFVHQVSGSSQTRRNCVWISRDRGATWSTPFYIDSSTEDAGYGDIVYAPSDDTWVVVSYQGTLTAASLKKYRLTIDGI